MTTTTRQAYRAVLVTVFVLVFSIGVFAESRPAAVSTSSSPVAHDLNTTLDELMRLTPATSQDLTKLQQQGGRLHWVTFWQGDKAQKGKMTAALQRNLQFAVPDLVHDAQASGGSLSTTFKLYRDLTAVCESLDSMLPPDAREVSSAVGIAAVSVRLSESEGARQKRTHEAKKKELQAIANRISQYAKAVSRRFPDGTVVVSEDDLAAQLRKRPDHIVSALNALLNEQKVERMPLTGFWRLNT